MAGRRICAGYYRRYDGKVVYVVSLATDADTGEETVIWTAYPFADVPRYCTSGKKSFCAFVEMGGERKAKYKRLTNMRVSEAAIERLEDEGFRGPVRERQRRQLEEEYDSRKYQQSLSYLAYAKDLCEHYNFDRSKYRFCVKEKRFAAITKSDFAMQCLDLLCYPHRFTLRSICMMAYNLPSVCNSWHKIFLNPKLIFINQIINDRNYLRCRAIILHHHYSFYTWKNLIKIQ